MVAKLDLMQKYPVPESIQKNGNAWAFWVGRLEQELKQANQRIDKLEAENADLQAQLEDRGSYAEV
jgi:hypothetical protein